jgi:glycosyltransferase involved in cell wall biosynthesis
MLNDSPAGATRSLVSVILPIHNGERYLAQAIASVLEQTYAPLEIVAVDDGSTDGSAPVAQAYGPPVRYVYRECRSTGGARNHGIELARGDFLAFLDQDDVWLPDKLKLQMAQFEADARLEAVFGEVEQFWVKPDESSGEAVLPPMQGYTPSVMLVTKEAFRRIGPFDASLRVGEWVDWYARAHDGKLNARRLPQLVARRRVHPENKGVQQRAARVEYARVLKASLDRRRASGELS